MNENKREDTRSLGSIAILDEENKFKDEDTYYREDLKQIDTLGLNATSRDTWLAFRSIDSRMYNANFFISRVMSPDNMLGGLGLCNVKSIGEVDVVLDFVQYFLYHIT